MELLPLLPPPRFADGLLHSFGPWVTNGSWLAKGEVPGAVEIPELEAPVTRLLGLPRSLVSEDIGFRLPFVAGIQRIAKPCVSCGGSGECSCLSCDSNHDCGRCRGCGELVSVEGTRDDDGQLVYVGDGVETVVAARMAVLLDGISVVRLGDEGPRAPLAGLDELNEIVTLVMPMFADKRPAAQAAEVTP